MPLCFAFFIFPNSVIWCFITLSIFLRFDIWCFIAFVRAGLGTLQWHSLPVLFGLHGSESSSLVVLSTWRDFKILPSHFGDFYFAENILVYGIVKGCDNLTLSRSNCVNEHFSANIDFLKCRLIVFEWKNGHSGLGKQETYPWMIKTLTHEIHNVSLFLN